MKTTEELRIVATPQDQKGLDAREIPLLRHREKCFLLTSPFIEPAFVAEYNKTVDGISDPAVVDDAQTLLYKRLDQLVNDVVGYIYRNHSASEWTQINQNIQESKKKIVFAARDGSQSNAAALVPSVYHPGHAKLLPAQYTYNQYGTSGYTQYVTLYTDGTNYYQSVYVYGASNVTWTCTWTQIGQYTWAWEPPGCNPHGPPVHSFYVSNQINGAGPNNASAGNYSAPTYVNLSNANAAPVGRNDGSSILLAGFGIICPVVGLFFNPPKLFNVQFGNEYVAWTGVHSGSPPVQDCYVTPACSNSRPWVVDLPYVVALGVSNYCAPAYTCFGVCVRAAPGFPWSCTGTNPAFAACFKLPEGPPNPPQACTPHP